MNAWIVRSSAAGICACLYSAVMPTLPAWGDPADPPLISAEEFAQMSLEDQRALVAAAFEKRLDAYKNVFVESKVHWIAYKYRDGQIGKKIDGDEGVHRRYRYWRLNDSYRMDTYSYGDAELTDATMHVSSSFNGTEGLGRYTVRDPDFGGRLFGRIDVVHDSIITDNRYAYWLEGDYTGEDHFLFAYLLEHRDEWKFDAPVDGDQIQLNVPSYRSSGSRPLGERELILDPGMEFLPIRTDSRWERTLGSGKRIWKEQKYTVKETERIGDVWMPIRIEERERAEPEPVPDRVVVYDMEAIQIEFGTVTPDDVQVPFTEGMEVVDAIQGISYTVGEDGEPAGEVKQLVGAGAATAFRPPQAEADFPSSEPQTGRWQTSFILINLGLLLMVGAVLLWRWKRKTA